MKYSNEFIPDHPNHSTSRTSSTVLQVFQKSTCHKTDFDWRFFIRNFLAINPGLTIQVANALGIGRGVDLLFYISILFGIIGFIVLYAKYRKLELLLTELIRNEAIRSATNLNEKNNNSL
ncbi:MAG: DUF2304 domain-containing protein [Bacteroidetes bacterium]|nr:DUF2304 domain-containing protein [Bacteroidota bacterium]